MSDLATADEVVDFWIEAGPDRWFSGERVFDEACRARFAETHAAGARCELDTWAKSARGALALCLLFDQLSRNMYRGTPRAYATDAAARRAAHLALERGYDREVEPSLRRFFFMPFHHSESADDQERSVVLHEGAGDAEALHWAKHHRDIVARFGRFPHRNAILGRESTPEELAFLAEEGSFKG
jgi:uncharacterized protein (DUF924 family)